LPPAQARGDRPHRTGSRMENVWRRPPGHFRSGSHLSRRPCLPGGQGCSSDPPPLPAAGPKQPGFRSRPTPKPVSHAPSRPPAPPCRRGSHNITGPGAGPLRGRRDVSCGTHGPGPLRQLRQPQTKPPTPPRGRAKIHHRLVSQPAVQGCSRGNPFYSWVHVNRKAVLRLLGPGLCLVLWTGTGCGGFNANVPVSPLWFIQKQVPGDQTPSPALERRPLEPRGLT
jgi:hypothetical protein